MGDRDAPTQYLKTLMGYSHVQARPVGTQWNLPLNSIGRYLVLTSGWLKNIIDRNIANYEKRVRAEGRAEGLSEGRSEGRAEVLAVLDDDTRKDAEQKLHRNGDSKTQA